MTIPNPGRGGLPVYEPTGATLSIANGTRGASFTGTNFVATNPATGALEYTTGVGDTLVVSGVGTALIESVTDATNLVLAEHWDYPTQTSIMAQGTPGWYIIRNSVPAFGSNAKAINDLLAKGSDSSPDQSRTIDNGAARMKLRINATGVPEIAVGASGAVDAALLPAIRIDPATGTVTFPNSTIGTGGSAPIRLHAGNDADPDTVETIDNGTSRAKLRISSTGQIELAAGASGTSDASLFTAIRINPANGTISFPAGGSVAGMTGAGGGGGGTFSGTGDPGLTRAQAMLTNFTTPPNALRTIGYDTPEDLGGGLYIKVATQPDHKGKLKTADNTWYELRPDHGQVWIAQFGAKKTTIWNARENDIAQACEDAVDYIVFSGWGGDLRIHPGTYYTTRTTQLKGGSFNVRGIGKSGVFIMPEAYVTGFVGHHNTYSFEAFGGGYSWRDFMVGEPFYTPGGIPGTPSAHCYICTQAGTTSSDGSQKPTGTGTNYTDGSCKFDYYREATRVELSTTVWSGEFSHITLYSHFDGTAEADTGAERAQTHAPAPGPWPQFPSGRSFSVGPWKPSFGFLGRGRSHVHHCDMSGFSGHGCAYIANGDFDFPTITGNVNFWAVTDCSFYYNTMDGLHASYSDGNAGYAAHIDLSRNGRWGIRDQSFLGNMYVQSQSAFDGRTSLSTNKRFPSSVAYAGYYYYARLGFIGAGAMPNWGAVTPTPGASNGAWELLGGDGTWGTDNWDYPTYVPGAHYEPGGAFASDNINARNLWNSCYIEGGTWPAQFNGADVVMGGIMQELFIGVGRNLLNDGAWYQAVYYKSLKHPFSVGIGGRGNYSESGESILGWNDGFNDYGLRTDSYENSGATFQSDNYVWAIDRSRHGYWLKNGQTSRFYGRGSPVGGGAFVFHSLFVGSDGNCRQLDYADSIPGSGTGGQGDRVYNRQANVGQPEGWVRTATAWRPMANLQ